MANGEGFARGMTLRDWVYIAILIFSAGGAVFSFATKTDLRDSMEAARKERMETITKSFEDHKDQQKAEMDRVYKQLDRIEAKLDRTTRK